MYLHVFMVSHERFRKPSVPHFDVVVSVSMAESFCIKLRISKFSFKLNLVEFGIHTFSFTLALFFKAWTSEPIVKGIIEISVISPIQKQFIRGIFYFYFKSKLYLWKLLNFSCTVVSCCLKSLKVQNLLIYFVLTNVGLLISQFSYL